MFNIRERTDKITHSSSGNKLRVRESEASPQKENLYYHLPGFVLCHYRDTTNFILYSWLRTLFPDCAGISGVCGLQYLLKPIRPANIDLWNVVGSHSAHKLLRQSAAFLHFFCHMFDLTSALSFHYTPRVLKCMELNKDKFAVCKLDHT